MNSKTRLPLWAEWPFLSGTYNAIESELASGSHAELLIGHIDQDGRVWGLFGPLPLVENISEDEFVKGRRFDSSIVLLDGYMLIRKDFRGNRVAFLYEKENLQILRNKSGVNVPVLYSVQEENCCLYKSMIMGCTLRDLMVEAGARILTVQTDSDLELQGLPYGQRLEAVWQRGQKVLSKVVPDSFLVALRDQVDRVHRAGIVKLSLTFGNVMVDREGRPWLIDFENSEYRQKLHPLYWFRRRQDTKKFRRIYGL